MSLGQDCGVRRFEAPPWESPGSFHCGRVGFSDPRYSGEAVLYAAPTSRATVVKSGLTRRGVIYDYVRTHPGIHVRGMAKELRIATGDLQYHLAWLEKHGFVKTDKRDFYRFVYPTSVFREEQEILLGALSQETPREILLCLVREVALTQGGLAKRLGHSQPTISWHMDRLVRLGVVSRKRTKRQVIYEVVADRDDILSFVKTYHPEVWKRWAGRLASVVVLKE